MLVLHLPPVSNPWLNFEIILRVSFNVGNLSLHCSYYFGKYSYELAKLFQLPYARVRSIFLFYKVA